MAHLPLMRMAQNSSEKTTVVATADSNTNNTVISSIEESGTGDCARIDVGLISDSVRRHETSIRLHHHSIAYVSSVVETRERG